MPPERIPSPAQPVEGESDNDHRRAHADRDVRALVVAHVRAEDPRREIHGQVPERERDRREHERKADEPDGGETHRDGRQLHRDPAAEDLFVEDLVGARITARPRAGELLERVDDERHDRDRHRRQETRRQRTAAPQQDPGEHGVPHEVAARDAEAKAVRPVVPAGCEQPARGRDRHDRSEIGEHVRGNEARPLDVRAEARARCRLHRHPRGECSRSG